MPSLLKQKRTVLDHFAWNQLTFTSVNLRNCYGLFDLLNPQNVVFYMSVKFYGLS